MSEKMRESELIDTRSLPGNSTKSPLFKDFIYFITLENVRQSY